MLFEIYWGSLGTDAAKNLAAIIKEAPKEDAFFLITVSYQTPEIEKWIKNNDLNLAYKTPRALTNKVHVGNGRNMTMWVLSNGEIIPKTYTAPVRRPKQLKLL